MFEWPPLLYTLSNSSVYNESPIVWWESEGTATWFLHWMPFRFLPLCCCCWGRGGEWVTIVIFVAGTVLDACFHCEFLSYCEKWLNILLIKKPIKNKWELFIFLCLNIFFPQVFLPIAMLIYDNSHFLVRWKVLWKSGYTHQRAKIEFETMIIS